MPGPAGQSPDYRGVKIVTGHAYSDAKRSVYEPRHTRFAVPLARHYQRMAGFWPSSLFLVVSELFLDLIFALLKRPIVGVGKSVSIFAVISKFLLNLFGKLFDGWSVAFIGEWVDKFLSECREFFYKVNFVFFMIDIRFKIPNIQEPGKAGGDEGWEGDCPHFKFHFLFAWGG